MRKPSLLIFAVAAVVVLAALAGVAGRQLASSSSAAAGEPSPFLPTPPFAAPRQLVFFGHVSSVTRRGRGYVAQVDPAEFLSGETANRAAIEDKVIPQGDIVPNDHYTREEGHKLLTYRLPASAKVTVVTNGGTSGIRATPVSVGELLQIVRGRNPKHRRLFEPKNGFWIRAESETIRSLDQQYSP